MDQHTGTPAANKAQQYRQTADEHVRTLKDFWKDFLVSGLFVLAAIVIIFACLAWFAANNSVNATGSSISAKGARYTLTAEGSQGVYENKSKLDSSDAMNITAACNLNNATEGGQLGPGSFGTLTFEVQPLVDDLSDINIKLSRCFATRGNDQTVVTDETQDSTLQGIRTLLSGHILFFKDKDENGYYSNPILDDTIKINKSRFGGSGRTKVPVKLYWVWPEQFQNFVLTGSINYSQNLFADMTANNGYSALLKVINGEETRNRFFQSNPGVVASSDMPSDALQTCSDLYNKADEAIGNTVEYVQIRFSASEDNSSNSTN